MIQGLLTAGIFSLADKIKLMKIENKVKNNTANHDDYYKLIEIYTKGGKYQSLEKTAESFIKYAPNNIIAHGRKSLCLMQTIKRKLKLELEIKNIPEYQELKKYIKKGIELIGPHDETAVFYLLDVGLIQYLNGLILKIEGDLENSQKYKEIGLKKVSDLTSFFPY